MTKRFFAILTILGLMRMFTPVSAFEAPDDAATQNVSTVGVYAPNRGQYFVGSGGNCGEKTPCYSKIQTAVDAASDGSEILVRQGTYALPTEAQWEYGARAGSTTAFYNGGITSCYDEDSNLNVIGWYDYNSESKTHSVAQKTPNAWGLYDMSGNVWEWCQDWYGSYSSSPSVDPTGPNSGSSRVIRGGCWNYGAGRCRSADRGHRYPGGRGSFIGFRLVRLFSGQQ